MRRHGFTLFEMLVVLALTAIILAIVTPSVVQWVQHGKTTVTLKRLRAAYNGTYGRFGTSDHGFLGDIGRLPNPASFATELTQSTGFIAGDVEGVRYGWQGEYDLPELLTADGWGNPFQLSPTGYYISAGPNGVVGDGDDVWWPDATAPAPLILNGHMEVVVFGPAREDMPGAFTALNNGDVTVQTENIAAGQLTTVTAGFPGNGAFDFPGLRPGFHFVTVRGNSGTDYQNMIATARVFVKGQNASGGTVSWARIYLTGSQADTRSP